MKREKNKGITLISLVITIAVLIILASVATYSGVEFIKQSKLNRFTTEMKVMQTEVNDLYDRYSNGETEVLNYGKELDGNANNVFTSGASGITDNIDDYKYYDQETIKGLGIDGVDGEFYVNVEKRSVVSHDGLEYEGVTYYTLDQLPEGLYNVEYSDRNTDKPTFDATGTVNNDTYTITVSNIQYNGYIDKWQVKYQKEGQDYWSTSEDLSFQVGSKGTYSVKLVNGDVESDPATVTFISLDGSWDDDKGINMPVIKDGMELVEWDETNKEWIPDNDGSSIDYKPGTGTQDNTESQWANAKVTIDGVESYFVWIPRYEYKIDSTNQTIDVKFIPISQTTADAGYIIHPAFTSNKDNGGWSEELPGIWVGKYESARSDATSSSSGSTSNTTIKVQQGVQSWRNTTIGDMYTYARAYSQNLNSHMLKNSEWGAVAYLTHSQYGRNGTEVTINANSNYITADGGIDVNPEQSSTGNVYGIYDLSGGAYEYVAAYYNGSRYLLLYGSSFASQNGPSTEYATAYTGTSASSAYKPGDATYETSGWHGDGASFVYLSSPFFLRGGDRDSTGTAAGVFYFYNGSGISHSSNSFRMCLAVK